MNNPAQVLSHLLRSQPTRACCWLPDDQYAKECFDRWLGGDSGLCRFPWQCKATVRGNPQTCDGYRCDAEYWRGHNVDVSRIMEMLAPFVGGDPSQYRLAGLLHDVDYLQVPHDQEDATSSMTERDIHPSLLVKDLASRGAPLDMTLAILEHAPHARLQGVEMNPMSQSLYFADNFATCKSAGCPLGEAPYSRPTSMLPELWDAMMTLDIRPIHDTTTASVSRWNDAVAAIEEVFSRRVH